MPLTRRHPRAHSLLADGIERNPEQKRNSRASLSNYLILCVVKIDFDFIRITSVETTHASPICIYLSPSSATHKTSVAPFVRVFFQL